MSPSVTSNERLRTAMRWTLSIFYLLALPEPAFAQQRTNYSTSWSTSVHPGKKYDGRAHAPRSTQKVQRPAAAVIAPLAPAANKPPAPSFEMQHAAAEQVGTGTLAVPDPGAPERIEHEATALEYCRNIGPIAGEARAAFLQQSIGELERELARKTGELEARIAEHKEWMAQRQKLMDQAGSALVQMFTRMRPDAAAQQVSSMDESIAAALLMKLEAKSSSAMLSEMPPARAARIVEIIAAAADVGQRQRAAKSGATR